MTIIEHLEQSISLPLLGEEQNSAYVSLLEPFYALLIARLAQTKVYTQLLQSHSDLSLSQSVEPLNSEVSTTATVSFDDIHNPSIFEQLWQDQNQRQLIIDELVVMHHIEKEMTIRLITSAATLAYAELKVLANGLFLPAFLQQQQSDIRHYLPVWAESVLTDHATNNTDNDHLRASHIPIDHNGHSVTQIKHTHRRNKKNNKRWLLFLLLAAMTALLSLWLFVVQPNQMITATPEIVTPVTIVAKPEPVVPVETPVSLLVAVDNSGSLYNCSATVGDAALQESLKQALIMSFGDQASICLFNIEPSVASSLTTLNIGLLPSLFTLLRSAPFARLQLQNNIITVESPDGMTSQRLLMDMRALAPTTTIVTTAPLDATDSVAIDNGTEPRLSNNGLNDPNNIQNIDNRDDNFNDPSTYNNGLEGSNNTFNSNNTIDNVVRPNNFDNNVTTDNRSTGEMSSAEADALASQVIVAEQLRNESRVESNIASE